MCLASKIMTFTVPTFIVITTHQYTNFVPKISNLIKLDAFYHNMLKIHLIYVSTVPLSVMKSLNRWNKICEKASQKAGTYK